jgi:hypothetical protein
MSYEEAIEYHSWQLKKGNIVHYTEYEQVLGYYQRYCEGDTCYLVNIYIESDYRQGRVFKNLYRRFFTTMPLNIKKVVGTSQKFGGKLFTRFITKERRKGE